MKTSLPLENTFQIHAPRPFNFGLAFGISVVAMLLLMLPVVTRLDFAIERQLYSLTKGFNNRANFWLETILHHRVKEIIVAFALILLCLLLFSLTKPHLRRFRRPLGYMVLAIALSTAIVTPLKALTGISCPRDLESFGGTEHYRSLLAIHPFSDEAGRCWPGGHASTGFSLIAVFFGIRDRFPRLARCALIFSLLTGTLLSAGRMLQGAHFLSHNLWTLILDWQICSLTYYLMIYRHRQPLTLSSITVANCDVSELQRV